MHRSAGWHFTSEAFIRHIAHRLHSNRTADILRDTLSIEKRSNLRTSNSRTAFLSDFTITLEASESSFAEISRSEVYRPAQRHFNWIQTSHWWVRKVTFLHYGNVMYPKTVIKCWMGNFPTANPYHKRSWTLAGANPSCHWAKGGDGQFRASS